MVGLVVLYLFSGVLRVGSGEQGLVARLGRLTLSGGSAIRSEGLHFIWPDPIDEKSYRKFLPYGYGEQRPNILAPGSLSLERHRLM